MSLRGTYDPTTEVVVSQKDLAVVRDRAARVDVVLKERDDARTASRELLAALKGVDADLLPYRGDDVSPRRAYVLSRNVIEKARAAIANADGGAG